MIYCIIKSSAGENFCPAKLRDASPPWLVLFAPKKPGEVKKLLSHFLPLQIVLRLKTLVQGAWLRPIIPVHGHCVDSILIGLCYDEVVCQHRFPPSSVVG